MKEKSLQKFTKSEIKINDLLSLETITKQDTKQLTKVESDKFYELIEYKVNNLEGTERDIFLKKVDALFNESTRNQLWEHNHLLITRAISNLLAKYGRMPTKADIAEDTKLSRQTISKHLNEYSNHPLYLEQIEQFKFMSSRLLSILFKLGIEGNTKAIKLYFCIVGNTLQGPPNNTFIENQNNFVQINNTIISQEKLSRLNKSQLNNLEAIVNQSF